MSISLEAKWTKIRGTYKMHSIIANIVDNFIASHCGIVICVIFLGFLFWLSFVIFQWIIEEYNGVISLQIC